MQTARIKNLKAKGEWALFILASIVVLLIFHETSSFYESAADDYFSELKISEVSSY